MSGPTEAPKSKGKVDAKALRRARLAAALRANLKRRKAAPAAGKPAGAGPPRGAKATAAGET